MHIVGKAFCLLISKAVRSFSLSLYFSVVSKTFFLVASGTVSNRRITVRGKIISLFLSIYVLNVNVSAILKEINIPSASNLFYHQIIRVKFCITFASSIR